MIARVQFAGIEIAIDQSGSDGGQVVAIIGGVMRGGRHHPKAPDCSIVPLTDHSISDKGNGV